MTPYPHLSQAPIREAVLDFRVQVADDEPGGRLEDLRAELASRYPNQMPIHRFHGEIRFDEAGVAATEQAARRNGYRLDRADGMCVVQVRQDGFTFSRLRPYESWDAMIREAWPVWERYVAVLKPRGASRIATRFINVLPVTPGPLDRLLTTPPQLPDELSPILTSFVFRYVTEPTAGIASIVSLATEDESEVPSLILDIDCFARGDFSVTTGGMNRMRELLQQLRERKNSVFFSTVKSSAVEMWK